MSYTAEKLNGIQFKSDLPESYPGFKIIPILFSTDMVKAITANAKTMTRRIVKPHKNTYGRVEIRGNQFITWDANGNELPVNCPYGNPGDVLWVRESFCYVMLDHAHDLLEGMNSQMVYKTSVHSDWMEYAKEKYRYKWKPSIHMPFDACRYFLIVKDIQIERLRDITEQDAICEGVQTLGLYPNYDISNRIKFAGLWGLIHGQESWDSNPYVWVITFERIINPSHLEHIRNLWNERHVKP